MGGGWNRGSHLEIEELLSSWYPRTYAPVAQWKSMFLLRTRSRVRISPGVLIFIDSASVHPTSVP